MLTGLGDVIGRLRTLSYDYEHQRCDARHVHAELQEIIAELQGILARSADVAVPDKEMPR
jgi:anti-sigma factor RsiW